MIDHLLDHLKDAKVRSWLYDIRGFAALLFALGVIGIILEAMK